MLQVAPVPVISWNSEHPQPKFLGILNILSQKLAKYTEKTSSMKCVRVGFHLFWP